ncbi:uncharacterized protein LOC143615569 [Bidens hawaiensis]|uniref:uncharacterized protein LOC143615569 n=1 Tax=Bidens hawaiensis TaxID=980011 RepID=UPI004049F6D6
MGWRRKPTETTFFVSNLPDRVTSTDLWAECRHIGTVSDTYIPTKRDRRGNWFGFIRFRGVVNVQNLLDKLIGIKVLNAKIGVTLAKFDRNGRKGETTRGWARYTIIGKCLYIVEVE